MIVDIGETSRLPTIGNVQCQHKTATHRGLGCIQDQQHIGEAHNLVANLVARVLGVKTDNLLGTLGSEGTKGTDGSLSMGLESCHLRKHQLLRA